MKQDLPQDEIFIDSLLLGRIVRRLGRAWLLVGPLLFAFFLGLGLLLVPQSFTSTASVAVQQPSSGASALSLLGAATPTKRYLGVLKSRQAALFVERRVNLERLYDFDTREDALDFLTKHVDPIDNATDGLLYIDVTLPGPPRGARGAATRRAEVKQAAALAANAYTDALRDYYVHSDTERDTVLLRGADVETRKARAAFNQASVRLEDFISSLGHYDPRALPGADTLNAEGQGATTSGAATETARLYDALAQVEAQIGAAAAQQQTQQRLVGGQLSDLGQVPGEDPLLTEARNRVIFDRTDLANLQVQFGPDNPRVIVARQRLRIDQRTLSQQVQGVRGNLTTEHVRSASELESLRAREQTLEAQIRQADGRLRVNRQLSLELARLQTEATLRLEALKATMAEAAKVRLDNVSAQSRMSVVDEAIPARRGSPGAAALAGISVALVLFGFVGAVLWEYGTQARRQPAPEGSPAPPLVPLTNGLGPEAHEGSDETARTAEKTSGDRL